MAGVLSAVQGEGIAPMNHRACREMRLKGVGWASVAKWIAAQSVKDDVLLESRVRFETQASWKAFVICVAHPR